ncbi:hypothetical protein MKW92_053716 [Papaver armeniacum]|nr:hypothetical protein MKW92_053716 [Papaver armeniacum]
MSYRIWERTDALDAAGNTTLLLERYNLSISSVDVLTPKVFVGLLVGTMLPYFFSAMTMKSVGSAALKIVEKVRMQFNTILVLMEGTAKPDYVNCVKISADESIKEMIH